MLRANEEREGRERGMVKNETIDSEQEELEKMEEEEIRKRYEKEEGK